jgi:hypothetical protein
MAFHPDASSRGSDLDPLDLLRYAAGFLLGLGTVVALVLWLAGITPDALLLVGALWSIYGLIHAVLDGFLEPLIDGLAGALQSVGLGPYQQGYSHVETMVARGEADAAAAEYARLAGGGDAQAQVRRAALLAGPLAVPGKARIELEEFRETHHLGPADDIRVGLALARLYEDANDPGPAMREIRRLLDLYPNARGLRHFRRTLAALKAERFGPPGETSGPAEGSVTPP